MKKITIIYLKAFQIRQLTQKGETEHLLKNQHIILRLMPIVEDDTIQMRK